VAEEGGSEVVAVAEVSGRQCAKGSLGVSDGGGIERLDASRQREFQYNHPSSTTYWRTCRTVQSFASCQNRQNHWVYAEPAARRKPCGKLDIGWHIKFGLLLQVGASSYHWSGQESMGIWPEHVILHTSRVKLRIEPFLVGSPIRLHGRPRRLPASSFQARTNQ
jgi:hypothetical protein